MLRIVLKLASSRTDTFKDTNNTVEFNIIVSVTRAAEAQVMLSANHLLESRPRVEGLGNFQTGDEANLEHLREN